MIVSGKAKRATEDPGALRKISDGAQQWLEKFKDRPVLGDTARDLCDMIDLVNDYAEGNYREIPKLFLAAIVTALIYVVSPIDLLPGFLDDVLVVGFIMDKGVGGELKKYREWEKNKI